jgi:hypothetical protein
MPFLSEGPMAAWMLLVACGDTVTPPAEAPPAPVEAPSPATPEAPAAPAPDPIRTAKVLESVEAGGYTYARMDACGQEAWVAGPPTKLEVGQAVEMPMGTAMANFEAPALKKTFDVILFVDWIKPAAAEPVCPEIATAPPPGAPGHGQVAGGDPGKKLLGVVIVSMKSGGYTYAQIDTCGTKQWIAGPPVPVQAGQTLVMPEGFVMENFESGTLKRTFDKIRFVDSIAIAPVPPDCT